MKQILACLLIFFVSSGYANYYSSGIDTYDPFTGFYYKAVSEKENSRPLGSKSNTGPVNLAITNPETGVTKLLFNEPLRGYLSSILFEKGFKEGVIEFYGNYGSVVLNNENLTKRDPKNKILVVIRIKENDTQNIYVSEKNGNNLKKLTVVPDGVDWHIDVKNSKIRVIRQLGNAIKIESFEW